MFFFRLGTLIGEGAHKPVEILALAESGAIVRIGESLEEGERLVLELNSHHRFEVRVEWSSDSLAGLEFEDRELVRATLAARDRAHPYRAPRLELAAEVVLRLGETCLTARARDVSEGGIKVELAEPGHVGREAKSDRARNAAGRRPDPVVPRRTRRDFVRAPAALPEPDRLPHPAAGSLTAQPARLLPIQAEPSCEAPSSSQSRKALPPPTTP